MNPTILMAYIDAGTGSLVLQFVVGGLLGCAFMIKVFWRGLATRASRLFGRKNSEQTEDTDPKDGASE
jgi:hypothetical protein